MSTLEGKDTAKTSDVLQLVGRLNYQYTESASKQIIAKRLYDFLKKHENFSRNALRLALYPELFMRYPHRKESAFVRKCLQVIFYELEQRRCVELIGGYYKTLVKPSLDECLRILRLQIFDLWR
jgi:hypothetical protein